MAGSTTVSTGQAGTDSGPASGLSAKTQRELHQLDRKLKVPKTPAQQVRGVVTAVLRLGGAFTCGPHLVTSRYVKAAYGNRQGCVKAAQSHAAVAEKLQFKSVRVDGSTATAVVIPSGGIYDGERITVSLVSSTGSAHWAVDALHSNVPVGP